jgi:hypothetical protein
MEVSPELFKDSRQLGKVSTGYSLSAQFAYTIFESTGSGKRRKYGAKQGPSRWLLLSHSSPNPGQI